MFWFVKKMFLKKYMHNIFGCWVFFYRLKQIYLKENLRLNDIPLYMVKIDCDLFFLWVFTFHDYLLFMFCNSFHISVEFNMMKILPSCNYWLDNFFTYLFLTFLFSHFISFYFFLLFMKILEFMTKIKRIYEWY